MTATATKPASRPFRVTVREVERLSASFVRVTFRGDDLVDFAPDGLDQRIKLVLPLPGRGYDDFPDGGDWYGEWRALPSERQNVLRTYTAHQIKPHAREVSVDFVCHGDAGPASAWVQRAEPGDELVLVGPDATCGMPPGGIEWKPGDAKTLLLAGDETAVPAVTAILASLPSDARGRVFLEVPTSHDRLPLRAPKGVDVRWLPRDASSAVVHGELLVQTVRAWALTELSGAPLAAAETDVVSTDDDVLADVDIDREILWEVPAVADAGDGLYAWLAGEAGAIKTLRRFLVGEMGVHRRQVAFMGYWRAGKSEN